MREAHICATRAVKCAILACRAARDAAEPGNLALFQELQADLRAQLPGASPEIYRLKQVLDTPAYWPALASADALALLEDKVLAWLAACDTAPHVTMRHLAWVLRGFADGQRLRMHRPTRVYQAAAQWLAARDWGRTAAWCADPRAAHHATLLLNAFARAGAAPLPPAAFVGLATLAATPPAAGPPKTPYFAAQLLDSLAQLDEALGGAEARRGHGEGGASAQPGAAGARAACEPYDALDGHSPAERHGALAGKLDALVAAAVAGLRRDHAAPAHAQVYDAGKAIGALWRLEYRLSAPLATELAECIPALAPCLAPAPVQRTFELFSAWAQHGAWAPPRAAVQALAARRAALVATNAWPYGAPMQACPCTPPCPCRTVAAMLCTDGSCSGPRLPVPGRPVACLTACLRARSMASQRSRSKRRRLGTSGAQHGGVASSLRLPLRKRCAGCTPGSAAATQTWRRWRLDWLPRWAMMRPAAHRSPWTTLPGF